MSYTGGLKFIYPQELLEFNDLGRMKSTWDLVVGCALDPTPGRLMGMPPPPRLTNLPPTILPSNSGASCAFRSSIDPYAPSAEPPEMLPPPLAITPPITLDAQLPRVSSLDLKNPKLPPMPNMSHMTPGLEHASRFVVPGEVDCLWSQQSWNADAYNPLKSEKVCEPVGIRPGHVGIKTELSDIKTEPVTYPAKRRAPTRRKRPRGSKRRRVSGRAPSKQAKAQRRYRERKRLLERQRLQKLSVLEKEIASLAPFKVFRDISDHCREVDGQAPTVWTLTLTLPDCTVIKSGGHKEALGYDPVNDSILKYVRSDKVGGEKALQKLFTQAFEFSRHIESGLVNSKQFWDERDGLPSQKLVYEKMKITPSGDTEWVWVSFKSRPLPPSDAAPGKLLVQLWETDVSPAVEIGMRLGREQSAAPERTRIKDLEAELSKVRGELDVERLLRKKKVTCDDESPSDQKDRNVSR